MSALAKTGRIPTGLPIITLQNFAARAAKYHAATSAQQRDPTFARTHHG
jgi:hypothetical protein